MLAVVVVVTVAAISVYVLKPSQVPLAVSDGSIVGHIEGNLTSVSSGSPLVLWLNATTHASQSGHPGSTLTMQVETWTAYVGGPPGHYYDGGYISTNFAVTIRGRFASNIHPSALLFTISQIGQRVGERVDLLWSMPSYQSGTNVTFDHNQELTFVGTGSATGREAPVNNNGVGPYYDFSYGDVVEAQGFVGHERFVGIRATVEGPFTPAVNIEMGFAIIDVPR